MKRRLISTLILCFIFGSAYFTSRAYGYDEVKTYNINKQKIKISIFTLDKPTNLEDRLSEKTAFYSLKLRYLDNFFSFNIPKDVYNRFTEDQRKMLVKDLLDLFGNAFGRFSDISGRIPERYKFGVTFAKTKSGHPFNRVYLSNKVSNIFTNFLPYENKDEPFTEKDKYIMLHEIGHSLLAITVGGLSSPKVRAIEEGVVDYIAGEGYEGVDYEGGIKTRIEILPHQAERMKGLTQLDIDTSIWGMKAASLPVTHVRGYSGITHHMFGIEFINAFIDVFGKEHLLEFLIRLKAVEDKPSKNDFGTMDTREIFIKMGFSKERSGEFEKVLHKRLKENVFIIREE